MALKPLEQWFCDRCGHVIEKPDDGAVHWRLDEEQRVHSMEIIHNAASSPRGGDHGCYPPDADADIHISAFLGPAGVAELLSMIDVGKFHDEMGRHVGSVKNIRNWTDTFRRLQIPYFEEARRHFKEARADGHLEGINEVALYLEDTLRGIVERYAD